MPYNFRQIPEVSTVEELRQWLSEELKLLSQSLNETTELELRASKHAPDRPREGMIVHVDGAAWNPGSGAGTYRYQGGLWVKVPTAPFATTDLVDNSVTNAKLADMASPRVKARGTAATGDPEDIAIGNGITLDSTSLRTAQQQSVTVDGSGLKLSGDAASPGNSQYYGTDGGGTKGFFGLPASGGLTLISTTNAPAAANFDITGLGGYKILLVAMNGLVQATGTRQHNVALSGNNGSSFGTARQPINANFISGALVYGCYFITRTDQTNNQMMLSSAAASTAVTVVESGSLGPINALRFTWGGGGGNFTGGSIDMYGLK